MEAETLALAQEMDFSMWALFARATLIVKLVMLMLTVASFWSWSIIVQKIITYRQARREAFVDRSLAIARGGPIGDALAQHIVGLETTAVRRKGLRMA